MSGVAVFDLDRTIIAGSSVPTFADMLRAVAVEVPAPVGRAVYFDMYERFGEDPVSMQAARFGARLFAGAGAGAVATAGRLAADVLASEVVPAASAEITSHRRAGRGLLLAASVPLELAEPLAENLGFDDVVATRLAARDGVLTGSYDGPFVWGPGKARRVKAWADLHDVDLERSWAYSDGWSDIALLESVGHPVAVNADLGLRIHARRRRWPRRHWEH